MKNIFVAYDQNYGIGASNDLLWKRDLPADLRRFKDITTGHSVVMGRKTFDSIGRPLPNRRNIVISRQPLIIDGVSVANSLEEAYRLADKDNEIFVLGGGEIYRPALDSADRIYATEVQAVFDKADVFFPAFDKTKWREVSREQHKADERNLYDYNYVVYERIKI
jgi:dihydrofolate reductase